MTQTEALKLALEALEHEAEISNDDAYRKEREAIREALAQSNDQKPVAWESLLGAIARGWCHEKNANKEMDADLVYAIATEIKALYTTPPQRTWVGLTDEERGQAINANFGTGLWAMAKDIEAKLKEKNT